MGLKRWAMAGFLMLHATNAATAENVTFEGDDGIRVVRWIKYGSSVSLETITDESVEMIECVALGPEGKPVASVSGLADMFFFSVITVDEISSVTCRQG